MLGYSKLKLVSHNFGSEIDHGHVRLEQLLGRPRRIQSRSNRNSVFMAKLK